MLFEGASSSAEINNSGIFWHKTRDKFRSLFPFRIEAAGIAPAPEIGFSEPATSKSAQSDAESIVFHRRGFR
jgi:hypothetical protein